MYKTFSENCAQCGGAVSIDRLRGNFFEFTCENCEASSQDFVCLGDLIEEAESKIITNLLEKGF